MQVRDALLPDAPFLAEIYAHYVLNFPYSFETEPPSAAEFGRRIAETQAFFPFFVCEEGDEILGYAYAHFYHPRKAYQWVCETSIYAKAGSGQRGVGSALYARLLPALKAQGFAKAMAVLGCPNEGSEAFHQKWGFAHLATLPNLGFKLGAWHDVKYYSLDLNPINDAMRDPLPYHEIAQK
ncbi:MAG: GNAT family N-acetyltransferase [Christensenellaceae bacterium]|jgi:phosphinothricin acetyltransferase|nr:GNAT family N-acetyltransferase [Christensenellaceae bacterium]